MELWIDIDQYIQDREAWKNLYNYFIKLIWKLIKVKLRKEEKVEGFTYKNYFKNEKDIDALLHEVITNIDIQLDIADTDNTKLISRYFVQK